MKSLRRDRTSRFLPRRIRGETTIRAAAPQWPTKTFPSGPTKTHSSGKQHLELRRPTRTRTKFYGRSNAGGDYVRGRRKNATSFSVQLKIDELLDGLQVAAG